ncbi:MAG: prefoldin subunit alpha [Candidatus Aenigmarchaeota archaeon]|nr:prefoldin subunit alpha [Candidatus Aenigmarchaeota archaeon]
MDKQSEFQQKFYMYQVLMEQQKVFSEQLILINQAIEDSMTTEKVIEELKKQKGDGIKNVLAPLGKESFVFAEIKEKDKILVDFGAGVLVKKPLGEAKKILESRRNELERNSKEVTIRLERINSELVKMEPEIQKILGQEKG